MTERTAPTDPLFWGGLVLSACALGLVAVLSWTAARGGRTSPPPAPSANAAPPAPPRGAPAFPAEAARVVEAWRATAAALCRDERLRALRVESDCTSGTLVLSNRLVFDGGSSQLSANGRRTLRALAPILLEHLQRRPRVWEHLEALEVRGHADPFAERDPYVTNLALSQGRALSVLLFLTSDDSIAERDRADLRQISVASGAAHSRPPADCAALGRQCNEAWRRVELRPVMDDASFRTELAAALRDDAEAATPPRR